MNPRTLYQAGAAAAVVAVAGGFFSPPMLMQAWHFAVTGCIQTALGCGLLMLLHQTTGGRWGERLMPALKAGNKLAIWCLIGWLPILFFLPTIYPWAGHPETVGDRAIFLNTPFFAVRTGIYLLVFGGISVALDRCKRLGAGGLIGFALVGYFLAIDRIMAIAPDWYSSGFPVVFLANQAVMGLAMVVGMQASTAPEPQLSPSPWRDPANLLLAMVVFWSYVSFTQFLIIWMGNLPDEIQWYAMRGRGLWRWVTVFLAVCNLFAPFFLLLSRSIKDRPDRLMKVAIGVWACQWVYLYWLIAPSLPGRQSPGIHWLDPFALVAAVAPFTAGFLSFYRKAAAND